MIFFAVWRFFVFDLQCTWRWLIFLHRSMCGILLYTYLVRPMGLHSCSVLDDIFEMSRVIFFFSTYLTCFQCEGWQFKVWGDIFGVENVSVLQCAGLYFFFSFNKRTFLKQHTLCPTLRLDVMSHKVDCVFQVSLPLNGCCSTWNRGKTRVAWLVVWNTQSIACDIMSNLEVGQRVHSAFS